MFNYIDKLFNVSLNKIWSDCNYIKPFQKSCIFRSVHQYWDQGGLLESYIPIYFYIGFSWYSIIYCPLPFNRKREREKGEFQYSIKSVTNACRQFLHHFSCIPFLRYQSDHVIHCQLPQYKMDHNHVLEHSLHQLLRENHFKNINFPAPHPVTALVGLTKKRRLAGPNALSRKQLMDMSDRSVSC